MKIKEMRLKQIASLLSNDTSKKETWSGIKRKLEKLYRLRNRLSLENTPINTEFSNLIDTFAQLSVGLRLEHGDIDKLREIEPRIRLIVETILEGEAADIPQSEQVIKYIKKNFPSIPLSSDKSVHQDLTISGKSAHCIKKVVLEMYANYTKYEENGVIEVFIEKYTLYLILRNTIKSRTEVAPTKTRRAGNMEISYKTPRWSIGLGGGRWEGIQCNYDLQVGQNSNIDYSSRRKISNILTILTIKTVNKKGITPDNPPVQTSEGPQAINVPFAIRGHLGRILGFLEDDTTVSETWEGIQKEVSAIEKIKNTLPPEAEPALIAEIDDMSHAISQMPIEFIKTGSEPMKERYGARFGALALSFLSDQEEDIDRETWLTGIHGIIGTIPLVLSDNISEITKVRGKPASHMGRILDEIHTNYKKYGEAGEMSLSIKEGKFYFTLTNKIKQDIGEVYSSKKGTGIMKTIAKLIGGEYEGQKEGDHYRVTVWFPLEKIQVLTTSQEDWAPSIS